MKFNNIPNYDGKNFDEYYKLVRKDFENVKLKFPLLNIVSLPTRIPKEIYIEGILINKELLQLCKREIDIKKNSMRILGIYPSNFPKNDLVISDIDKKINWNEIPRNHKHENEYKEIKVLCTHHPNGEINEFKEDEKSIEILMSAWRLFIQYKEYKKNKKWKIRDLPHGGEADKKLRKEKKFYDRK